MIGALIPTLLAVTYPIHHQQIACSPPRANWMPKGSIVGLVPVINQVRLDHFGHLFWNGKPISLAKLGSYLRQSRVLDPQPILFFSPASDAPCGKVEVTRAAMDHFYHCQNAGVCAEGDFSEWQSLPLRLGRVVS